MATIDQINVGGTTYDLDYDAVFAVDINGDIYTSGVVNLVKGDFTEVYNKMNAGMPVRISVIWFYGSNFFQCQVPRINKWSSGSTDCISISYITKYKRNDESNDVVAESNTNMKDCATIYWTASGVTLTTTNTDGWIHS